MRMSVEALRPSADLVVELAESDEGPRGLSALRQKWLTINAMAADWGGCFFPRSAPLRCGRPVEPRSALRILLGSQPHQTSRGLTLHLAEIWEA